MKLEDQVCSLELSKKLKELGVKQESVWYWYEPKGLTVNPYLIILDHNELEEYQIISAAFTVAELGEIIGCIYDCACFSQRLLEIWNCSFARADAEGVLNIEHTERASTEADCRALMLIHLIEKGMVKL